MPNQIGLIPIIRIGFSDKQSDLIIWIGIQQVFSVPLYLPSIGYKGS